MKAKIKALEESRDSYVKLLAKASETLAPYEEELKKLVTKISEAHDSWVETTVKDEFHEVLSYTAFDIKAIQVDVGNVPEFFGRNIEECEHFVSKLDQRYQAVITVRLETYDE